MFSRIAAVIQRLILFVWIYSWPFRVGISLWRFFIPSVSGAVFIVFIAIAFRRRRWRLAAWCIVLARPGQMRGQWQFVDGAINEFLVIFEFL